jgi:outer membrane immunogenic protein
MRAQMLASIAVLSASAGSALAGNLATPPAPFSWTGCYVGVHAGFGASNSNWTPTLQQWEVLSASMNASGALGGAQAGCNYQTQNLVLGLEGEVWGAGLTGDTSFNDFEGTTKLRTRSDLGADVAARVGYAVDRVLLYGKVGVAWADYRFTDTYDFEGFADNPVEPGLLLGLGAEYAIDSHWSVKGEFDAIVFGGRDFAMSGPYTYIVKIRNDEELFKVGANYRF